MKNIFNNIKLPVLMTLAGVVSACTTMEFVNGPKMDDTVVRETWHHQGLNGLLEFSKPLDVNYHCANQQWDTITIEKTVFNAVSELSYPYVTLYAPWTIVYECRDPID